MKYKVGEYVIVTNKAEHPEEIGWIGEIKHIMSGPNPRYYIDMKKYQYTKPIAYREYEIRRITKLDKALE